MEIMFCRLIVIGLCALGPLATEASARFRLDSVTLVYADPEYYDLEKTEIALVDREADPSEMQNAINSKITIIKQIPENTTVSEKKFKDPSYVHSQPKAHLTVSGWSEDAYNKPTGINVTVKVCDLLRERFIMGPLLSAMGFTREECPPGPGNYVQEGYTLPNNTLPEFVPRNKYMSDFEIIVEEKAIFVTRTLLEVHD